MSANLSQLEIDALISSLGQQEMASPTTITPGEMGAGRHRKTFRSSRGYRLYDFRRPEKLSKEQIRLLRTNFGRFTRSLTNYLTGLTRTSIDTTLVEVDQTNYGEIFKSHGIPTLMCTFALDEERHGMLKVNLNQLYAALDRLMGGPGSGSIISRPLTEFERGLMGEICQKILNFYADAVELPTAPVVELIDTDERVIPRTLAPDEFMVRALYDLRLGATSGHLSIYTPLSALTRLVGGVNRAKRDSETEHRHRELPPNLATLPLPVTVELGTARMSAADLTKLAPGDVISLQQEQSKPLRVRVGGVPRFAGRPGMVARKMAVIIEGPWRERT
ncbi:MAG: flagellar motor switch protein FliM [Vulcanimicrobiota bacterium]